MYTGKKEHKKEKSYIEYKSEFTRIKVHYHVTTT